jgi:hypothetical protein
MPEDGTLQTADTTGDRSALSKSDRQTLDALFAHPIAHNLQWKDVLALFAQLGTVEQLPGNEASFRIGGEHRMLTRPHGKDLTIEEIMALRQFLDRAGWSSRQPHIASGATDFLIAIDHHEARIYHMDVRPTGPAGQIIHPYDPHHFLRHLTHKDQTRQRGERAAEDPSFYERIAQAVSAAVPHGRIVIVGHGKGHSDAAHHLQDWIHLHHPETFQHIACAIAADLSALTPPQLLALGREALAPAA